MASTSASHTNNQALLNIVITSQFSLKNTYIYACSYRRYSSISHGLYALIDDDGKDVVDDDDNDSG